MIRRLLAAPLTHFVALGLLFYGLRAGTEPPPEPPPPDVPAELSPADRALYLEALERGLDDDDPVIGRRLLELMRGLQ